MSEIESWIERQGGLDVTWFIDKYKLKSNSRKRELVTLRSEICTQLRHKTMLTFSQIGQLVNRHHANVIHSCEVIKTYRRTKDAYYKEVIEKYTDELNAINYER